MATAGDESGRECARPAEDKSKQMPDQDGSGTLDRLSMHRKQQELQKEARGALWEENDLIFPNTIGKPMSSRNMYEDYYHPLSENGLTRNMHNLTKNYSRTLHPYNRP
jgi:hypothetical protein